MDKIVCPKCGTEIVTAKRSTRINRHFHAHITQISRESGMSWIDVKYSVLLTAIEMEPTEGGSPYPYFMVSRNIVSPITGDLVKQDLPEPYRTSACTNKQLMTAVEAAHRYAALIGITLRESEDE